MVLKTLLLSSFILSLNLSSFEERSVELKILVYNTHGLPGIFLKDKPSIRFPEIGKKIKGYDISLLQEDYSHHEKLSSELKEDSVSFRGELGNKLVCPFCIGSGLTVISNLPNTWKIEVENETFRTCSGWIRGLNDCFAHKGFQLIKITPPVKESFFILNTHLDAGKRDSDRSSRKEQLEQIISALNKKVKEEALILAGDLNLNSKDPKDLKLLAELKVNLRLTDPFLDIERNKKWSIVDYILYRQGRDIKLKILNAGEDESFVTKEGPLSDHPALFVEISI
tara:strand:+ start:4387 stop:5232 length:846 start_codon:yes stop_codon:yes gene_type:complete